MSPNIALINTRLAPLLTRKGQRGGWFCFSGIRSRHLFPLLLIAVLALSSCLGGGEVHIKGKFVNLKQAELYIYSPDGGLDHLDTIRVENGKFKWRTLLNGDATFYIVFPNMTEQVVFASGGDRIKLKGDGGQIKSVEVSGNDDNKLLTKFRLEHNGDKRDSLLAAMRRFVKQHPDSRAATHLQREINQLDLSNSILKVGDRLPQIALPPDSLTTDYTTDSLATTKPVLMVFWATWKSGSNLNYRIRRMLRTYGRNAIQPVCISLDTDPSLYRMFNRQDSVDWTTRCYRRSWETPLVQQLAVRTLPYIILADQNHRIWALGNNWEQDIQPMLEKLMKGEQPPKAGRSD